MGEHIDLIRGLDKLSIEDRKKEVTRHLYREFRVIVFSSFENGYIKHKVGKFMDIPAEKIAQASLEKIKSYL